MDPKDPSQLAHCHFHRSWIGRRPFMSSLHIYLIRIHQDHAGDLCGPFLMPSNHSEYASYIQYNEVFDVLLLLCSTHYRWMCSMRSSTDNPRCFRSTLPICWTSFRFVFPKHTRLASYLSHSFHACFLCLFKGVDKRASRAANWAITRMFAGLYILQTFGKISKFEVVHRVIIIIYTA